MHNIEHFSEKAYRITIYIYIYIYINPGENHYTRSESRVQGSKALD